jgi:hypothetical protein
MPEPYENLIGSFFDANVLLADFVAARKILPNRSSHVVGGAQQVQKVGAALAERKGASDEA